MKKQITLAALLAMLGATFPSLVAAGSPNADLTSWSPNCSPQEIGKRVAEHFCATPHTNFGRTSPPRYITYPETCTWYGALTFARLTDDTNLTSQLIQRMEPLLSGDEKNLIPAPRNVDSSVFGIVPFEISIETGDPRCLKLGKSIANAQWETPEDRKLKPEVTDWVKRGLSWQTRFWIDDMYMITIVQTQAYRATHDQSLSGSRRPRDGGVSRRAATAQRSVLSRAGRAVLLGAWQWLDGRGHDGIASVLPENHPQRARIMAGYRKMMAALLGIRTRMACGISSLTIRNPGRKLPAPACSRSP